MDDLAELVRAVRRVDSMELVSRRLVADWHVANGDAERGAWIRLACDFNAATEPVERARVDAAWRAVWRRNSARWWKHFGAWGLNINSPGQYACGLIETIQITARDLLQHGAALFGAEPVVSVWLDAPTAEETRALAAWPWLGELRVLSFDRGGAPGTGVDVALAAGSLDGLGFSSGLTGADTRVLAASQLVPESLRLGAGSATETETAALLAAPFGARIAELWVTGDGWRGAVLDAIARPLRRLWLFGFTVTAGALATVLGEATEDLAIHRSPITTAHLERIVACSSKLARLTLRDAGLGDPELNALASAGLALAKLDVADNPRISDAAALALAGAYPRTELDLRGCKLDEDTIEELTRRPGFVVRTQRVSDMPPGWYGRLP